MKVRVTPSARAQSLSAIGYILRENPLAARRFRQGAGKILRRLERFPRSGRSIPEFPGLPSREALCPPYRFFYRIQGATIWVVAVWHGAQLPRESGRARER